MVQSNLKMFRCSVMLTIGLFLAGCKPYDSNGNGIVLGLEASKVILVDAPSQSCKAARSTSLGEDMPSLSFNAGRLSLAWNLPDSFTSQAILKVIYVSNTLRSSGLTASGTPMVIAGLDLACIMKGYPDQGSALTYAQGATPGAGGVITPYDFQFDMVLGGFTSTDALKRRSFGGTASILVYAIVHESGRQDSPLIGRNSYQFSFGGIF